MRRVVGRLVLFATLVVAGFVLVAAPRPAFACSCVSADPTAHYNAADAVFVGTVTSITDTGTTTTLEDGTPLTGPSVLDVVIDVDTAYKGVDTGPVTVHTISRGSACGFTFAMDERYLVYAHETDDGLDTGLCSGTRLASDATLPPPGSPGAAPPPADPPPEAPPADPTIAVPRFTG